MRRVVRAVHAFSVAMILERFAVPILFVACLIATAHAQNASAPDPRMRLYDGPDGATCRYFNSGARFPWRHPLGDWRDATGQSQGTVPYDRASIKNDRAGDVVHWSVTALVRHWSDAHASDGGLFLGPVKGSPGGTVAFSSREAPDVALRPKLRIDFKDGSAATTLFPIADTTLDCSTVASLGNRTTLVSGEQHRAALGFDVAALAGRPIANATLELAHVHHDAAGVVGIYALEPPVVAGRVSQEAGIAARYPRDEGIGRDPDVIFATGFESPFWRSEWSYVSLGSHAETVDRDDVRKFEPLFASALRVEIPQGTNLGLDMGFNFLDKIGAEPDEIYFRYYIRFADDWIPTADGGKLPGPAGTYGRAGWGGRKANGTEGWSLRGLFLHASTVSNPVHGRIGIGTYAYHAAGEDFFGDEWDWNRSTQLLERNRWYCLEQRLRMNTPAQRDGLLRAWIDGVMAFDKQDVYLRDIPSIRIEKIWMNVYHGGTTKAAEDLHLYIDNVVIARRPIGCVAR